MENQRIRQANLYKKIVRSIMPNYMKDKYLKLLPKFLNKSDFRFNMRSLDEAYGQIEFRENHLVLCWNWATNDCITLSLDEPEFVTQIRNYYGAKEE